MASYVGIDIGKNTCKVAMRDGKKGRLISSRMPENLIDSEHQVVSPESMAAYLSELRKTEHIRERNCILVLAESEAFFRHVTLPAMSADEVQLNLPYEFRDYITGDPSEYNYDYIVDELVEDEEGKVVRLELFAAAAQKKTVNVYADILHKAGFRLKAVVPAQLAYSRLISRYNEIVDPSLKRGRDLILVDIGHEDVVVSLLHGPHFEAAKIIDFGCCEFDRIIADLKGIDPYTAGSYKYTNFEGVLDTPECQALCDRFGVEINKIINFYNFNNPDKDIEQMYLLGGGALIPQLDRTIRESVSIPVGNITELMSPIIADDEFAPVCALAIGALLEGEVM